MSKAQGYIDSLTATGEISFTVSQFCNALNLNYGAATSALRHLLQKKSIVSPSKGYYLILTPEFRASGCLPADYFIDDLIRHWGTEYYIGLLSAALYHGAAHQQPQMFQVMIPNKRKSISCGHVSIEFIQNSHCTRTPKQALKTRTGTLQVSTPEATAMDMLKYIRHCGGINRIATVLDELAETMSADRLVDLAAQSEERTWVHRLGFLLDRLGHTKLAEALYTVISKQPMERIPLVPYSSMTGAPRDKKWSIGINAKVESDLDDIY